MSPHRLSSRTHCRRTSPAGAKCSNAPAYAFPSYLSIARVVQDLRHQILLRLRIIVRVVPVFLPGRIGDRRPARRIVRPRTGGQAGDLPIELRSEEEGNGIAMPVHRRQGTMGCGFEAAIRPAL